MNLQETVKIVVVALKTKQQSDEDAKFLIESAIDTYHDNNGKVSATAIKKAAQAIMKDEIEKLELLCNEIIEAMGGENG